MVLNDAWNIYDPRTKFVMPSSDLAVRVCKGLPQESTVLVVRVAIVDDNDLLIPNNIFTLYVAVERPRSNDITRLKREGVPGVPPLL